MVNLFLMLYVPNCNLSGIDAQVQLNAFKPGVSGATNHQHTATLADWPGL